MNIRTSGLMRLRLITVDEFLNSMTHVAEGVQNAFFFADVAAGEDEERDIDGDLEEVPAKDVDDDGDDDYDAIPPRAQVPPPRNRRRQPRDQPGAARQQPRDVDQRSCHLLRSANAERFKIT